MIRVGITGQSGFVGTHLYNTLGLFPDKYQRIPFEDAFFGDPGRLREFVRGCDAIVHLAAMNRHPNPRVIYDTNITLVEKLIAALKSENVRPHVLFSSSTQEEMDNGYGRSKLDGRLMFESWAREAGAPFTGLVVPNVFGPFGAPDYNSFVATFCHRLTHGGTPAIINDGSVKLIYVGSLAGRVIEMIDRAEVEKSAAVTKYWVPHDFEKRVSEILARLEYFKELYFDRGFIPVLEDGDDRNLFNTFRSYIDHAEYFPVELAVNRDARGIFVETLRLGTGGQVSFSTTLPGVMRGDHYHTRKIERFTVIKGRAKIEMRRIGTDEVIGFELDGSRPAYVDMPVWYTHNITNTGDGELYTQFWINEWYDPQDADTYFEKV